MKRIAAVTVVFLSLTVSVNSSEQRPLDDKLYSSVYATLFIRPEIDKLYLRQHKSVITVRAGGENFPETQITLTSRGDEFNLQSVRSKGRTLSEQLVLLQATDQTRLITEHELVNEVELEKFSLSSERCPALKKHALKFYKMEIIPERHTALYAPSVTYEIWFTSLLEEIQVTILAPDPTSTSAAYWGSPSRYKKVVSWIEFLLEFGNERCEAERFDED